MKRAPSIVDALRRESIALRSGPARDLVPAVEAALAREGRRRRRRLGSLAAGAALLTAAALLPGREPRRDLAPDPLAVREATPAWTLDPGRILRAGGAWWSGLREPLREELDGLTEDARKVAGAVARRLPDSIGAAWGG